MIKFGYLDVAAKNVRQLHSMIHTPPKEGNFGSDPPPKNCNVDPDTPYTFNFDLDPPKMIFYILDHPKILACTPLKIADIFSYHP